MLSRLEVTESLSDKTTVGMAITSFERSPQFDGYSRVTIQVTDDLSYTTGTDTGRTLTVENPYGTQEMAEAMLESLKGYQYQPYTADGAILDPAAELGDGVSVGGVYSGIYSLETSLDSLCAADIKAPCDEEIDHEYPYTESTERSTARKIASVSAEVAETNEALAEATAKIYSELSIQADEISAKVTKEGGDTTSFGWSLTEDGFILSSGSSEVFRADKDGITVTGKIQADSGYIGGSSGFTIKNGKIYSGKKSAYSSEATGVYIGTNGIRLGKNFYVNSSGSLTASSGTFTGTIDAETGKIGGFTIGSTYLNGGKLFLNSDGSMSGNGWSISSDGTAYFKNMTGSGSFSGSCNFSSGSLSGSFSGWAGLSTSSTIGGTNVATYIENLIANTVTANWYTGKTIMVNGVNGNYVYCTTLTVSDRKASWKSKYFKDGSGKTVSISYLGA